MGTRCPAELLGHLTWEMQQQLGRAEGPAGSRVGAQVTLPGLGGPPTADTSCRAQRQLNQQTRVYVKPFVKLSQQIPSINPAPLALVIQRGLIKLSL